jgi:hypothetical protein
MPDHAVALILTYAEAGALFEIANVGLHTRAEVGKGAGPKAVEAMKKLARGMGFETAMDGPVVLLVPLKKN